MRNIQAMIVSILVAVGIVKAPVVSTEFVEPTPRSELRITNNEVSAQEPGTSGKLQLPYHEFQTFNNCGPTTLAMILRWYGNQVTGVQMGEKMRPYQNPKGNNDDKTVFMEEFGRWAQEYGLKFVVRPGGSVERLKALAANNFPVVVKTLLHANEDIAHFRIVTGWDDQKKRMVQSDSYEKKESEIEYGKFLQMWQPFNYVYIVIYKPEQEELVKQILGQEWEEKMAWGNAMARAVSETTLNPGSAYPVFNLMTAHYHLGNYEEAVKIYEQIKDKLPRRMLWYQIEPIEAYVKLGRYEDVLEMTQKILDDGNRAFSELYDVRSQVYAKLGETEKAQAEYDLAIKYNKNYERR